MGLIMYIFLRLLSSSCTSSTPSGTRWMSTPCPITRCAPCVPASWWWPPPGTCTTTSTPPATRWRRASSSTPRTLWPPAARRGPHPPSAGDKWSWNMSVLLFLTSTSHIYVKYCYTLKPGKYYNIKNFIVSFLSRIPRHPQLWTIATLMW